MPWSRPLPCLLVMLGLCAQLRAAEEDTWHGVHPTPGAPPEFFYPFDGRSPKIPLQLHNHEPSASPALLTSLRVNGQPMDIGVELFSAGPMIIPGFDYALPAVAGRLVYDGRFGPPPAIGETKSHTFEFVLTLAPGATSPYRNEPSSYAISQAIKFTNLGDSPALTGPITYGGTVRFATPPAGGAASVRAEFGTPYSPWFPVAVVPTSTPNAFAFAQALPLRNDWHVRLTADGHETRIVWLGYHADPVATVDVTLAPVATPELDYRRVASIATPTGFWRGAVSESEGTVVTFPGQETWKAASNDAEARALRAAARLSKYRLDGTRVWEHAPGWETWGGDMSADGRFVAYALHPAPRSFYTPAENKLVLLDGATGAVIWTKSAPVADVALGRRLGALEVVFSPDARLLAVGSTAGHVTLFDRATGNVVWSIPGPVSAFGEIRKLRFTPDQQFLYCGSEDGALRKVRVSDGGITWRSYVGGWSTVHGLDFTADGDWIVVGTRSLDTAVMNARDGVVRWLQETQHPDAVTAPDGRHVITAGGQILRTAEGAIAGMTKAAGVAWFTPDGRHVLQIGREFRLHDLGGKPLRTFESPGLGATAAELPQWVHATRDGRHIVVLARDMVNPPQTGIVIYERRAASAAAVAPAISSAPLSQAVATGHTLTLVATATGTAPLAFRWQRNGADVPHGSSAGLTLPRVAESDSGRYSVMVSNGAGTVASAAADVSVIPRDVTNPARIANLSVRANVGAAPLIVGFAIGGAATAGTKPLLIRGAGPALSAFNVVNAARDPRVTLYSGTTTVLANDNWAGSADVADLANRVGAFPFRNAGSTDAAMSTTAVGGSYTVHLAHADPTDAVVLAEIYDAANSFVAITPRLVNISARADVGGASTLIAGFVVTGHSAKTVLLRGIGPTLARFDVPGALANPQLTVFREGAPIASNDDWFEAANAVAIGRASAQVGAFPLAAAARDAALLLSLPPGSYTAQVSAPAGTAGNALVEIYEVPASP